MNKQPIGYIVLVSFLSGAIGAFIIASIAFTVFLSGKQAIYASFKKDLDTYLQQVLSESTIRELDRADDSR